MNTLFRDPPRARVGIPDMHWQYVRPPTSSLDWMGAPWESPTSLDFRTEIMDASRIGVAAELDNDKLPIHPTELVGVLAGMWHQLRRNVIDAERVVDARERLGVTFGEDFRSDRTVISARVKCWPAIPGVTIPTPDVTW